MSKIAKSFRDLEIWQLSVKIAHQAYFVANQLPPEEAHVLGGQIKRAAISLSANIAEGFRRQRPKEFAQFLLVALGSAAELESHCELARTLFNGNVSPAIPPLLQQLDSFQRMTTSFREKLRQRP